MSPFNKEERDKIREKIKKLFALATSPNEAEALAAATKARELMTKYNLEQGELDEMDLADLTEIVEEITEAEFDKKLPAWVTLICDGIDRLYRTKHFVNWGRRGHCTRTGNFRAIKHFQMVFVGAKDDAAASSYLLSYILRSAAGWAKDFYSSDRCRPEEKARFRRKAIYKNYYFGLASRVHQRLLEEANKFNRMEEQDPNCRALVVRKEKNIEDYMKEELDLTNMKGVQKYRPGTGAFNSGFMDGDKIHISGESQKLQAPQARITHK